MVQKNCLDKIIVICGPTASGKTALSVSVAKALDTSIIYADSLDIYKGLNIGTAKPTEIEMCGVPHYLIDVVSPKNVFSVGDYKEMAEPVLKSLIKNKKIPIICGGTGFYINSLLYDLSYGNGKADLEAREKYFNLAKEYGNEYVYGILKEKDPESCEKIHCNDLKRVVRALEIFESGIKKSDIKDELHPKYDYLAYAIDCPRDVLYENIEKRVDKMFENGLVEEVKELLNSGVTENDQCMQGIGYKELFPYLRGETGLDETKDKIKLNTKHYAKRQITFFKKLPGIKWLRFDKIENLTEIILEDLYDRH